jgi:hypothetical protein
MIGALLRRLSARLPRVFLAALLAASLCAQDKEAAPLPWNDAAPPCSQEHVARALEESTRHGEWVDIALADGIKMESRVVYPERKDKAPVVLVIQDIRDMSDWARALGDQLAQDGFIAIVPDFLSGKGKDGGGTKSLGNDAGPAIRKLSDEEVCARLDAAKKHGESLPSSNGKTAVLGFCWGGSRSFGGCATRHMGNTFDRAHRQHSSASPRRSPPPSVCWMTRCSEKQSDEGQFGSQHAAPSRGGLCKRIVRLVANILRATVRAHG